MNKETFDNLLITFKKSQLQTLTSKGNDYSKEDLLSNFKEVAATVNITPAQVALTLICVKTSRLGTLLSSNTPPSNESVQDSVLDLANYSFLLHAILSEESKVANLPLDTPWTLVEDEIETGSPIHFDPKRLGELTYEGTIKNIEKSRMLVV